MKVYEVGGAVRDALLGMEVVERDWVVVGSSADELLALGYQQVGREFPVFLHPETKEEYALARTERKIAPGHTGFSFQTSPAVTLEADLARRDLTINAIAKDAHGNLIDPFGGQRDIDNHVLRHVSDAFREDPLRVLRAARFAAKFKDLGFGMDSETIELMARIVADDELKALQPERVWTETHKALKTSRPDVFFEVLRECSALRVVFPEIDALFGVPQPERWHPEIDSGVHTLMALKLAAQLSDDSTVRYAVLMHDLGKATTLKALLPSHHGHGKRSAKILESLAERLPVPRRFQDLATLCALHHDVAHRAMKLSAAKIFKLIVAIDGFRQPQRFESFLLACEADARGRGGLEQQPYPQAEHLRHALRSAQAIDASTLRDLGLIGPDLGEALREKRIGAIAKTLN